MLMWAQLLVKVSWLWRTQNNLPKKPPGFSLLWCHCPKRGQYEQTLVGFPVHWQGICAIPEYSPSWESAWHRSALAVRDGSTTQLSEQTQIQGKGCFQNKSKYPGAEQQTDKRCASRCTPQSLEKLMSLISKNNSSPYVEAQGAGWALHRSSCY